MFSNTHTIEELATAAYVEEISKHFQPKPNVLVAMNERVHQDMQAAAKALRWTIEATYEKAADTFLDHIAPLGVEGIKKLDDEHFAAAECRLKGQTPPEFDMLSVHVDSTLMSYFDDFCEITGMSRGEAVDKMLAAFLGGEGLIQMESLAEAIEAKKPNAYQRRIRKGMPKDKAQFDRLSRLIREYVDGYTED